MSYWVSYLKYRKSWVSLGAGVVQGAVQGAAPVCGWGRCCALPAGAVAAGAAGKVFSLSGVYAGVNDFQAPLKSIYIAIVIILTW